MPTTIDGLLGVSNVAPNSIDLVDLKVTLPFTKYYETTVAWTAGASQTITCGFAAKLVVFEAVAITAVNGLAIGETAQLVGGINYGGANNSFGPEARKFTGTGFAVQISAQGLLTSNAVGAATSVSPAQMQLRVKVFG